MVMEMPPRRQPVASLFNVYEAAMTRTMEGELSPLFRNNQPDVTGEWIRGVVAENKRKFWSEWLAEIKMERKRKADVTRLNY